MILPGWRGSCCCGTTKSPSLRMVTEAVGIPVTKHRLSSERRRIIDPSEDSIHLLVDDAGAAPPAARRARSQRARPAGGLALTQCSALASSAGGRSGFRCCGWAKDEVVSKYAEMKMELKLALNIYIYNEEGSICLHKFST